MQHPFRLCQVRVKICSKYDTVSCFKNLNYVCCEGIPPSQNTNAYHMVVECSKMFANIKHCITVFNEHLFDVFKDSSKCEKHLCLAGTLVTEKRFKMIPPSRSYNKSRFLKHTRVCQENNQKSIFNKWA